MSETEDAKERTGTKRPRKDPSERHHVMSRPETLMRYLAYLRVEAQDRYVKDRFSYRCASDENVVHRNEVLDVVMKVPFDPDGFFANHGMTLGELAMQMSLNITGPSKKTFREKVLKRPRWILEEDERGSVSLSREEEEEEDADS